MSVPRFAVIGDPHIVRSNYVTTRKLKNAVKALNKVDGLEYVLVTGDIAHNAHLSQYKLAKSILDKLTAKYFCCAGNHDTLGEDRLKHYTSTFGAPQYATEIGDYNLLVADHRRLPHLRDFAIDTSKPAIALKHDANDPNLIPYFKKHNVKFVVQGHYHEPGMKDETIDGIRYIICAAYFIGLGTLSNPIVYRNFASASDLEAHM